MNETEKDRCVKNIYIALCDMMKKNKDNYGLHSAATSEVIIIYLLCRNLENELKPGATLELYNDCWKAAEEWWNNVKKRGDK